MNLFMFFWNLPAIPKKTNWNLKEPLRVVIITRPRENVFRVFYNQADPSGNGPLKIVNWYDGENLGLNTTPLLKMASKVFKDFNGRIFHIPVIHVIWLLFKSSSCVRLPPPPPPPPLNKPKCSCVCLQSPPWQFVEYYNETYNETLSDLTYTDASQQGFFRVTGGRDHNLLKLMSAKMNFRFEYLDSMERSQGSSTNSVELNFTGGLGMLQRGVGDDNTFEAHPVVLFISYTKHLNWICTFQEADLFLGDIAITWERRRAVEFSFFTLADSGAFVTHAPRRLNEALALLRPFRWEVWPPLVFTIFVTGPLFYFVIAAPFWWKGKRPHRNGRARNTRGGRMNEIRWYSDRVISVESGVLKLTQLNRMRFGPRNTYANPIVQAKKINRHKAKRPPIAIVDDGERIPEDLFNRCIWFAITLFLRQCK